VAKSDLSALTEPPVQQPKEGAEKRVNSLPQRCILIRLPAIMLHSIAASTKSQRLLTVSTECIRMDLAQPSTSERGWLGSLLRPLSVPGQLKGLLIFAGLSPTSGVTGLCSPSHPPAG